MRRLVWVEVREVGFGVLKAIAKVKGVAAKVKDAIPVVVSRRLWFKTRRWNAICSPFLLRRLCA